MKKYSNNKNTLVKIKRKAFTLAEVLITVGIIGVVATLTIPVLIQQQQDKKAISIIKKSYSDISQAFTLAVQANGAPDTWTTNINASGAAGDDFLSKLAPYLKITQNCHVGSGCFPPGVAYRFLNGNPLTTQSIIDSDDIVHARAQLADGTLFRIWVSSNTCKTVWGPTPSLSNVCGGYDIDINGFDGPNQYGQDFFAFMISEYGIEPVGSSPSTNNNFDSTCPNTNNIGAITGYGCAAWAIYNDNLDYLKSCALTTTLSWAGNHSCN